jgi:hypothetical protein
MIDFDFKCNFSDWSQGLVGKPGIYWSQGLEIPISKEPRIRNPHFKGARD